MLRFPELKGRKGIPWSRMHIDRLEREGKFPRRVKLGPGTVAWIEAEIDDYLAAKAAEREKVAA